MAEKGLAVSQIILLVLGILVLAVVAYLLYTNFVSTGGTIGAEQCRVAATNQCTSCSVGGFATGSSCQFDRVNSLTQKETVLSLCQKEGNLFTGAAPAGADTTKYGYVECARYTGAPLVGGGTNLGSSSQTVAGDNTGAGSNAPSETGGSSGSTFNPCPTGFTYNPEEETCT